MTVSASKMPYDLRFLKITQIIANAELNEKLRFLGSRRIVILYSFSHQLFHTSRNRDTTPSTVFSRQGGQVLEDLSPGPCLRIRVGPSEVRVQQLINGCPVPLGHGRFQG